ncbi:hypothetical protein NPIL_664711 [Nephila pilipes]|uniref:Uncharacterized protein n=1 Tax=Nephila pilipes TaxID=299642 RepID=A0A8X6PZI1_NEPPI|nr:hypothetical protein NPIL_664711 [Nephila pilipes]
MDIVDKLGGKTDNALKTDDVSEWLIGDEEKNNQFLMSDDIIRDVISFEEGTASIKRLVIDYYPSSLVVHSLQNPANLAFYGHKARSLSDVCMISKQFKVLCLREDITTNYINIVFKQEWYRNPNNYVWLIIFNPFLKL